MTQIDGEVLEALAASFEARARQAFDAMDYTKAGYLTRDSLGLKGLGIAFDTAARELRETAGRPAHADLVVRLATAESDLAEARARIAELESTLTGVREAGDWMAEAVEDSLVNLAEWEHSPGEDALAAWQALERPAPSEDIDHAG